VIAGNTVVEDGGGMVSTSWATAPPPEASMQTDTRHADRAFIQLIPHTAGRFSLLSRPPIRWPC